jgi:hypothetical protein
MWGTRAGLTLAALLLTQTPTFDDAGAAARVSIVRRFVPADRISGRYQYVPFDVPPGTSALNIQYTYDRANGDNVVDLGLFEPGPLELGSRAFRGYSGGSKAGLELDRFTATPGYRPGPMPPGRWHVLLGLYKVADAGVDVTITVETSSGPLRPEPPSPPAGGRGDAASGPGWYLGALHTHTVHSDGSTAPLELLRLFRDARFDFVVITDHNTTTAAREILASPPPEVRPLWILGEEVTTPGGHASVWGLDDGEWVDFRVSAGDARIKELVAAANRQGGVFSINHPASTCVGCGWTHEVVEGIEGIEISNGRHGEIGAAIAIWERQLRAGRRITAVGSSDWHGAPNPIDNANVRVYATKLTEPALLAGIRAGRVIVMRSARDRTPDIIVRAGAAEARIGETLGVADGTALRVDVDAPGLPGATLTTIVNGVAGAPFPLDNLGHATVDVGAAVGYVRFELHAPDGGAPYAITNPVYLVRR